MADKTEICNLALAELSVDTITLFGEDSEPGRKCRLFWDTTRRTVLTDYNWSFAKKIFALSESSNDSVINWLYAYVCPSDCVIPRKLFIESSDESQNFDVMHSSEGSQLIIVANTPNAYLEYTADIIDTTLFDSSFVEALKYNLAAKLAKSLTGNDNLKKDMIQLYIAAVDTAKRNNNLRNYKKPDITKNSPFYDCR